MGPNELSISWNALGEANAALLSGRTKAFSISVK